jgi:protein subunit release factor A
MDDYITIPENDKKLLEECHVETFKARGKGGQHVNSTQSAVRISHIPTKTIVTCQDERSQYVNKKKCLLLLRKKLNKLNYKKPKRIPTKKPYSAKLKILKNKKKQSVKKQSRKKPKLDT